MTNQTLFSVTNHHVEGCGEVPALPDDVDGPGYYRSYFENPHGEQWLFVYNKQTHEAQIRGGDCGWDMVMKPVRTTVHQLVCQIRKRENSALLSQVIFAGVPVVPGRLMQPPDESVPVTLVVDTKNDSIINCDFPERVWIEACLATVTNYEDSGKLLEPISDETLDALLSKYDLDDEDDEEEE